MKARLGNETEVLAEPTPEIHEILGHMTQAMGSGDEQRSYLEGGKISTDTVAPILPISARALSAGAVGATQRFRGPVGQHPRDGAAWGVRVGHRRGR